MKKGLLFALTFCAAIGLFAQNPLYTKTGTESDNQGRFRTLEVRGHTGGHMYGGETLTSKLESGYGALEVRFAWQSRDEDIWGKYGYPSYGVGAYAGFLGDPDVFGNPNALFGFINFPISKPSRRNQFNIEPSLGLTYNLEPFDPENNPLNDAIGARMAVYFNLNFGWAYQWTPEMDITYGLDFSHFSNGRSFTPNWGLNMFGINVGMRYHYNADQHRVDREGYPQDKLQSRYLRSTKKPNEKVPENQSVNLYTALGTVQTEEGAGTDTRYGTFSLVLDYQHKFNNMHSVSAGLDYFVDNSLKETYPEGNGKNSLIGIHAGYDFMFWRITTLVHGGTYITEKLGKDALFLRPAIRYDLNKWAYAQVGLKTIGFAADWVEFGIGIKPFRW
ncbi:acyloxyacyl hydrolase [Robiginitalea aurantiaca]|uniref:Acyloxyacyl hydrolase n=1 Tax=Robiginitalea aurantiaca TaxID=3056915 RepID=A0ABT7WBL7_9FLAO|nr:acyloxyacyl hydrolase [Robiginitalea aurantiaca]MDM9630295.1 acyloxyacyl hydrolase [Robiginitalea aurantiaca]